MVAAGFLYRQIKSHALFCHEIQLMNWKFSQILKALKPMTICFTKMTIVAELNVNRSYDDGFLLDVSTTYIGTDLVQITDVFNA